MDRLSRRDVLKLMAASCAPTPLWAQQGRFEGVVPFANEAGRALNARQGKGLEGRLGYDLSRVRSSDAAVSNEDFFIRTALPESLSRDDLKEWSFRLEGDDGEGRVVAAALLKERSRPRGTHLLECSGNSRFRSFGLMSTADWGGVALPEVFESQGLSWPKTRILIEGYDRHSRPWGSSTPGASWIFTPEQLTEAGAFLALEMNGEELPPDHGGPVRLLIPGWYGCCQIKWVQRIVAGQNDSPATGQMREFAGRTHQRERHRLARDYEPALMDFAAMPVRIERWNDSGSRIYRVIGIGWGGRRKVRDLRIRFGEDDLRPVQEFAHKHLSSWNVWRHLWRPESSGRYQIELQVGDSGIPTRRLDSSFYARAVVV